MTNSRIGRAVLRAYLNVREIPRGPATALFDATEVAGTATALALRIRRHGVLSMEKVQAFGDLLGVGSTELVLLCLPTLTEAGVIEVHRNGAGNIVEVEEQVGVAASVLDQCAAMWWRRSPRPVEACAIESADIAAYSPLAMSDHRARLEAAGYPPDLHGKALTALEAVNLISRLPSQPLGEDVIFSPYVWGSEAVDIARFMKRLPTDEREVLEEMSRRAAESPGLPLADLKVDNSLSQAARKVGLVDQVRVMTTTGAERGFLFSPGLENNLPTASTDAAHERKLFVAHVLNGFRYGYPGTGKIRDPIALVSALISKGKVGPTTSIGTDYPLLEAHGLVRVLPGPGKMAYLELVQDDVARDALDLLRCSLGKEDRGPSGGDEISSLWLPGSLSSPERDRHSLPSLKPGAEAELIGSAVHVLRQEIAETMRGERV